MHAGRQDVALLRRVWSTERHGTSSTPRSPRASPACARSSATRRCCTRCSACACARARLHALGRAPAERRAGRLRARGRPAPAPARRRPAGPVERRGRLDWAREECRPLEDASDEREPDTIFHRLPRVNSLDPSQRAVAYELVRGARRPRASRTARSRACWPTQRSSRWPSAGPRARAPGADPRAQREHAAPPRPRDHRSGRARARARRDPGRRRPPDADRRQGRAADRARRGARARPRVRGRARLRAARRAGRPAADRHRHAHRARRARGPHAAGLAARGRRRRAARAPSRAAARCASGPDGRSRSPPSAALPFAPCASSGSCSSAH